MRFFLPEWDDLVDPHYDFLKDKHSEQHEKDPRGNDVRIWDIYGLEEAPVDGVLVSRMTIQTGPDKEAQTEKLRKIMGQGIHRFLRLPDTFPVMGDCGAWGYVNEEVPPFETGEMLSFYTKAGFDVGVSIDHLIVKSVKGKNRVSGKGIRRQLTSKEITERYDLTLQNAQEMMDLWKDDDRLKSRLRLLAAVQGHNERSYAAAVKRVMDMGYDYVGLGGLAASPSNYVRRVLESVAPVIRDFSKKKSAKVDLHVFGVTRTNILKDMLSLSVASFDSASYLRKAWLSTTCNYYLSPQGGYTAVRIPQASASPRSKSILEKNKNMTIEELERLESGSLAAIREYARHRTTASEVLQQVMKLEDLMGEGRNFREALENTLKDRPWEKCDCRICREIGVEVMLLRGNNRNRRRGFHNVFRFHKYLRELAPRTLVFTMCTETKSKASGLIPAYRRYMASGNFKRWWLNVKDIPGIDVAILSAKHGLIPWSKPIGQYDRKLTENDIGGLMMNLRTQVKGYDRLFFYGLGLYRVAVQELKDKNRLPIEIYPSRRLTERNIDIIEYMKQIVPFREAVLDYLKIPREFQAKIDTFEPS